MKPTAWFDPSNGVVSTDRDCPLFTPLGQVWPLFLERTEQEPVCPECKAVVLYECVACSSNNYPPQRTEQEPVAYLCENAVGHRYFRWKKPSSTYKPIALYTSPPQRTWVGLTDEEIQQGYETTGHYQTLRPQDRFAVYALARAIEAKLKEKNT